MRRVFIIILIVTVAVLGLAAMVMINFNLSALPEPGKLETRVATRAKRILIARASRSGVPAPPAVTSATLEEGDRRFGAECAMCHGRDAHNLTDNGRWMYPRAADLLSPDVQKYSDQELFWIIKNGVRFTGMPAFGNVESDEHIWQLVQYLRSMARPGSSTAGSFP